jgi:hypothetical protein
VISRRLGDFELGCDERQAKAGRENECSEEHVGVSDGKARMCGRAPGILVMQSMREERRRGKDSGKYRQQSER